MKDIDFDELDRAVSSLMSSVPKNKPVKADDDDTTLVIPDSIIDVPAEESQDAVDQAVNDITLPMETEPVIVPSPEPEQTAESEPEETLPPAASIQPTPSRGRFMDMVRPSQDMRQAPSLVRRQGISLQPSRRPTMSPEAVTRQSEAEVDQAAQTIVTQELEDTASIAAASNKSNLDTPMPVIEDNSFRETEDVSPLSSPFLADAKVEKRPLGRPEASPFIDLSNELAEDVDQPAFEPSVPVEEPSISPNKDAQRPEEPLPAELDSKLLDIETGADLPHMEETPPQSVAPEAVTQSNPAVVESASPSMDTSRAMAAASIPQQYKLEAGHEEEVPAGGIYDTQPLAHPATSKPGWLWILAIIGILVLGAAGGAAVYYLGLI